MKALKAAVSGSPLPRYMELNSFFPYITQNGTCACVWSTCAKPCRKRVRLQPLCMLPKPKSACGRSLCTRAPCPAMRPPMRWIAGACCRRAAARASAATRRPSCATAGWRRTLRRARLALARTMAQSVVIAGACLSINPVLTAWAWFCLEKDRGDEGKSPVRLLADAEQAAAAPTPARALGILCGRMRIGTAAAHCCACRAGLRRQSAAPRAL